MERGRVLTKLMKSGSERVVWPIEVVTKPDAWRRSNIVRALAEAAIPAPGGYANDLAELRGA